LALKAGRDARAPGLRSREKHMTDSEFFKPNGWHSRGYLPHFDGGEIPQAITFRLHDSLPQTLLEGWRQELEHQEGQNFNAEFRRRIEHYIRSRSWS
jgi:hypothetical protein